MERDVVWTLQGKLNKVIAEQSLDLAVFNDYGVLKGIARSDYVLLGKYASLERAAEFKFEPDHSRKDIPSTKFPVVTWDREGVFKDLERIQEYVRSGAVRVSYAVFIDEGGAFHQREVPAPSCWSHWESGPWVLEGRADEAVSAPNKALQRTRIDVGCFPGRSVRAAELDR